MVSEASGQTIQNMLSSKINSGVGEHVQLSSLATIQPNLPFREKEEIDPFLDALASLDFTLVSK